MNRLTKLSMAAMSAVLLTVASVAVFDDRAPWASAQTEEAEPAIIPLGPEVRHIDPYPWGLMYRYAAGEDSLPTQIDLAIHIDSTITAAKSLEDQITEAGGSHVAGDIWRVPTSALTAVVQRVDVVIVKEARVTGQAAIPAYGRMWGSLEDAVAAYRARVPASQAALKSFIAKSGSVGVVVDAASSFQESRVRDWMTDRGITPVDEVSGADTSDHLVFGMVPLFRVVALSDEFPTARLYAESYGNQGLTSDRSTWPSDLQDFEASFITFFTNGTVPSRATSSGSGRGAEQGGVIGQNGDTPKTWDDGLVERLREHGVKEWRDDGHTALGIKVGIIDWGFSRLNDTPGLVDLDIWDKDHNPNGNAYCQPVRNSTWPSGMLTQLASKKCEPLRGLDSIEIDHGVNIAELVKDIAPSAELFYAQANSPRQVYKAARWLKDVKDVDVIVHAAGWPYDGPGDGTSPLGGAVDWTFDENPSTWDADEHSPYRYEPSPLNTVEKITDGGPVWINAAGNMELVTMRKSGLSLVGGTTSYKDYLVLNSSITAISEMTAGQRACQRVPWDSWAVYSHNLRWADSWTSPTVDLDFFISVEAVHPESLDTRVFVDTADGSVEQLSSDYPVRRAVHQPWASVDTACLRIKVNRDDEGNLPTLPSWIQFQIITNEYNDEPTWNLGNATTGHSIVNPASSASPNLLAMGARDFRSSSIELMDYSSHGPVYRKGASLTSEGPGRIKPDVTAASGAATWTKFNNECDEDDTAAECGDDLYFGGTSAATGQTGGMAALVVQLFKEIGIPYKAADVAGYLKDAGVQIKLGESDPSYGWGHGFIKLPCRPIPVTTIPYTSSSARWNTDDCKSTRRSGAYADYYTFHSPVDRGVKIDVESSVDSYLYLIEGAYNGGTASLDDDDNGGDDTDDARIKATLTPGTYTVAVTTRSADRTGSYTLKIQDLPCEDPTNFQVKRTGAGTAKITWSAPDDGMTPTGYYVSVYRWNSGWVSDDTLRPSATATSFTDSGLVENSWYTYKIWTQCAPSKYSSGTDWLNLRPWSGVEGASGPSGPIGEPPATVPADAP